MPLRNLTIGNPPDEINVIIEISEGSSVKYEIDKESGFLMVDRFVHTAMVFPFNYGFLPHSLSEDGDPLDVLVISERPVVPGCVISARPIGILEMEDESGKDAKIIAVPRKKVDPWYADIEDIMDLDEPTQRKIHHFFSHYKSLEDGKWVKVTGTFGRERARQEILDCIARANDVGVK